jgi:hypothetical protein
VGVAHQVGEAPVGEAQVGEAHDAACLMHVAVAAW